MGLFSGWNYHFTNRTPTTAQQTARRATFDQYQTFPENEVQGRGTLVSQDGLTGGKYWNVIQPPQVYAHHTGVRESLTGAGVMAGGLYGAELAPNPHSSGFA